MERVIAQAIPNHFCINACASTDSVLVLFENQTGRAFAHYKPIPIKIKRATSDGCFLAAHRSDESKGSIGERTQRSFGCSGNDHIGEPVTDITNAFTDRHIAAGTAIRVGGANAAESELDGDVTMSGAAKHLEGNSLMDRLRAAIHIGSVLMFGISHATERAAEADSDSGLRIVGRKRKTAIVDSKLCRSHGKLSVAIQSLESMRWKVSTGFPIVNLSCRLGIKRARIESRYRTDRRLTVLDTLPKSFFADANWRYRPQAGHDNSSHASASAWLGFDWLST